MTNLTQEFERLRRRDFIANLRAEKPELFHGALDVVRQDDPVARLEALRMKFAEEPCPPLSRLRQSEGG